MKISKKTAAVVTAASLLAVGNIGIMPRDLVKDFMLSVSAVDSDIVASGKFGIYGDNLTWELDSKGTLTISGQGEMNNSSDVPWDSYSYDIVNVVIEDGVTSIGYYAFRGCHSLTSITIPDSVTSIGEYALNYCYRLASINVDSENKCYISEEGVLFNKDKSMLIYNTQRINSFNEGALPPVALRNSKQLSHHVA